MTTATKEFTVTRSEQYHAQSALLIELINEQLNILRELDYSQVGDAITGDKAQFDATYSYIAAIARGEYSTRDPHYSDDENIDDLETETRFRKAKTQSQFINSARFCAAYRGAVSLRLTLDNANGRYDYAYSDEEIIRQLKNILKNLTGCTALALAVQSTHDEYCALPF